MSTVERGRPGIMREEHASFWIFVAMLAVSTAAILIRLSDSHPLTIATWRLVIAEIILLPFAMRTLPRDMEALDNRTLLGLVLSGLALALHFGMWIWSFQFTSVASSVLLVTTHPVFVALIAYFLFSERLGKPALIGIGLAFAGSFLIFGGDLSLSSGSPVGNLLALGGSLMAGIYILAGSWYRRKLSLPTYAFLVYGPAALFLLAASLILRVDLAPVEMREYVLFALLAVGPMLAGHTIYNWALKYVSPTLVSVSLLGEPVGASLLAMLILSELPGPGAVIGGPIVLLGIYLVATYSKSENMQDHKLYYRPNSDAAPDKGEE
ncbi:MAG TPA: DMT family transporter [Euryarchaeota archaeon]|nr:DMT family transporter [Euryarchaeota archaeon]